MGNACLYAGNAGLALAALALDRTTSAIVGTFARPSRRAFFSPAFERFDRIGGPMWDFEKDNKTAIGTTDKEKALKNQGLVLISGGEGGIRTLGWLPNA